jgi:hypothetical protein
MPSKNFPYQQPNAGAEKKEHIPAAKLSNKIVLEKRSRSIAGPGSMHLGARRTGTMPPLLHASRRPWARSTRRSLFDISTHLFATGPGLTPRSLSIAEPPQPSGKSNPRSGPAISDHGFPPGRLLPPPQRLPHSRGFARRAAPPRAAAPPVPGRVPLQPGRHLLHLCRGSAGAAHPAAVHREDRRRQDHRRVHRRRRRRAGVPGHRCRR